MKMSESIRAIKQRLSQLSTPDEGYLQFLENDSRKGVKSLLAQYRKKQEKQEALHEKYQQMCQYEKECYLKGIRFVAGIDEVGRGPLAGPVVAAAVILPQQCEILGLNDSKQLSAAKREDLVQEIEEKAIAIGIGMVDHRQIDQINIYQSSKKAMLLAVNNLSQTPEHLLIDAMNLDCSLPQTSLVKGDARSVSIAAASVIAKVFRDNLMKAYHEVYPYYGFDKNAGYGTKTHLSGLEVHGICPIHRKSYAPVKKYLS